MGGGGDVWHFAKIFCERGLRAGRELITSSYQNLSTWIPFLFGHFTLTREVRIAIGKRSRILFFFSKKKERKKLNKNNVLFLFKMKRGKIAGAADLSALFIRLVNYPSFSTLLCARPERERGNRREQLSFSFSSFPPPLPAPYMLLKHWNGRKTGERAKGGTNRSNRSNVFIITKERIFYLFYGMILLLLVRST